MMSLRGRCPEGAEGDEAAPQTSYPLNLDARHCNAWFQACCSSPPDASFGLHATSASASAVRPDFLKRRTSRRLVAVRAQVGGMVG